MRMCAIVATQSSARGVVCDVPPALYPLLVQRKSQIAVGELLAVCLAFRHFPEALAGESLISFVDNIAVIHIIVNGAASVPDLSVFAQALHRRIAELGISVWWEYVPSASNISDGGSRVGCSDPTALEAGIPLTEVTLCMPPDGFPASHPNAWRDFWRP